MKAGDCSRTRCVSVKPTWSRDALPLFFPRVRDLIFSGLHRIAPWQPPLQQAPDIGVALAELSGCVEEWCTPGSPLYTGPNDSSGLT